MNNKNAVVEYAAQISEEDLKWLTQRLTERLSGDLSEALNYMSKHKSMDNFLSSAKSAEALYEHCDFVRDTFQRECKKKGLILKKPKKVAAA